MSLPQCQAIVLFGRDSKGNRAGLIPPRRCQRPATQDAYCGLHAKQADLQELLRECMSQDWEIKVRLWEQQRRQAKLQQARKVMAGLAKCANDEGLYRVASFFRGRQTSLAETWVDTA